MFGSALLRDDGAHIPLKMRDRLRASELLGSSSGDFVEHHVIDAGESLYELLGGRPLPKLASGGGVRATKEEQAVT